MAKVLEAIFYNENAAQNAISLLEKENINIGSPALYSGGKSLISQTFENAKCDVLGSSTGFVYNPLPSGSTPSVPSYPMPNTMAIVSDGSLHTNHKFDTEEVSELPDGRETADGSSVILSVKTRSGKEEAAQSIMKLCGAYRINFR